MKLARAAWAFCAILALGFASPALAIRRAGVATRTPVTIAIDGALSEWNPGLLGIAPPLELTAGTSTVEEGVISKG